MIAIARLEQVPTPCHSPGCQARNVDGSIINFLRALVERLEASLDNHHHDEPEKTTVAHWEDEEYKYTELKFRDVLGPDIDINIHGDLIMIRLEASEFDDGNSDDDTREVKILGSSGPGCMGSGSGDRLRSIGTSR